jgi:hypothetical protein
MSEFIKMKLSEARAKFENLDELSQDTVRTYYNKAGEQGKKIADKMKMGGGDWSNDGSDTNTLKKRAAGRTMALKRRSGEVKMSEEAEELDEISKATMGRYINKAKDSIDTASYRQGHKEAHGSSSKPLEKKLSKRHKGISMAVTKLTREEAEETEVKNEAYNKDSVDKAISSSRQKIGGREAKKIHALLKGSSGYAANKNAEETKKTFPNVKHLTKDGHPDWKKHGMGEEVELDESAKIAAHLIKRYGDNVRKSHVVSAANDFGVDASKLAKAVRTKLGKTSLAEEEQIDELSKGTLNSYVIKSLAPSSEKSISNLASKGGFEHGERGDEDPSAGEKDDAKSRKRSLGVLTAVRKLAKEEAEETDGCMTDTSSGGANQIAQSKVGEIYKKPSKSVDAMNATAVNKRVPAVESAILDVMAKTFEKRKMFEDASNISIISPAQRQDWLNVSTGNMEVVDYFNKYKV